MEKVSFNTSIPNNSSLTNFQNVNQNNNIFSNEPKDKILFHKSIVDNNVKITEEESAEMLGFFSRKLRNVGIGFIFYKKDEKGKLIEINELEALKRLKNNEEVLFQMTKFSNFNLSVSNLFAVGALVSPIDVSLMNNIKDLMDKSNISNSVTIKNPGKEVKTGIPFSIKNLQELRMIYQIFNPNSNIDPQNKAEKVAKLLSSFIPKTFGTPYNWKFFDSQNRKSLKEIILNSLSKSIKIGSLIGLTSSFLIAPIGAVNWKH